MDQRNWSFAILFDWYSYFLLNITFELKIRTVWYKNIKSKSYLFTVIFFNNSEKFRKITNRHVMSCNAYSTFTFNVIFLIKKPVKLIENLYLRVLPWEQIRLFTWNFRKIWIILKYFSSKSKSRINFPSCYATSRIKRLLKIRNLMDDKIGKLRTQLCSLWWYGFRKNYLIYFCCIKWILYKNFTKFS